jgi:hypothetical protein
MCIPAAPAYGVYISPLTGHSRACGYKFFDNKIIAFLIKTEE